MTVVAVLLFLGVTLAAALAPGPSVLLVTSLGVRLGLGPALRAALGVLLANLLFAAVSAAGLLALLKSSQTLFEAIKLAGAAYLALIGVQMLRSAARRTTAAPGALPVAGLANPLWQGFLNQLSNPQGPAVLGRAAAAVRAARRAGRATAPGRLRRAGLAGRPFRSRRLCLRRRPGPRRARPARHAAPDRRRRRRVVPDRRLHPWHQHRGRAPPVGQALECADLSRASRPGQGVPA